MRQRMRGRTREQPCAGRPGPGRQRGRAVSKQLVLQQLFAQRVAVQPQPLGGAALVVVGAAHDHFQQGRFHAFDQHVIHVVRLHAMQVLEIGFQALAHAGIKMGLAHGCDGNDRKNEKIGNLKVIENIFKKLGVRYSPDFDINLDKIQNGDLNPEFNLMYANFWLKIDLETLIFIILLLTPNKDPFAEQLITYEEANDYLKNMVEKRGDEYAAYLINQPSNFWFLVSSFKYPSYNNNSTSRKRFLMELKIFLKFMKKGRLSQQECNEIADGIKMAYSLLNQFPKELNLDDKEGENYE